MIPPVLAAHELHELLAGHRSATADPLVIADVRWYLDGRDGCDAYCEGHLPGARWLDLEAHLTRHDLPASEGRHPLPEPGAFADSMAAFGVGDDTVVVAYDDTGGLTASRLVLMLRMLGHEAAVLDGGLQGWVAAGGRVEAGAQVEAPARRTFTAAPWPADRLATLGDVARASSSDDGLAGCLLDARVPERFTGAVAAIDPRPGHIPGARNAPWNAVLQPDGRFLAPEALRAHYTALGAGEDTIAYCGSGVSACMNILAMERAGLVPARLYVASYSGWSADPHRPVELGTDTTDAQGRHR